MVLPGAFGDGCAAGPSSAARLKIQGPSGSGWTASMSPRFSGEPKCLGADAEKLAALVRLSQVRAVIGGPIDRDMVMRPERRHTLAGPAIAVAGDKLFRLRMPAIEIVIGDEHELADGGDDVGRRCYCAGPRRRFGKRSSV